MEHHEIIAKFNHHIAHGEKTTLRLAQPVTITRMNGEQKTYTAGEHKNVPMADAEHWFMQAMGGRHEDQDEDYEDALHMDPATNLPKVLSEVRGGGGARQGEGPEQQDEGRSVGARGAAGAADAEGNPNGNTQEGKPNEQVDASADQDKKDEQEAQTEQERAAMAEKADKAEKEGDKPATPPAPPVVALPTAVPPPSTPAPTVTRPMPTPVQPSRGPRR